MVREVEFFKFAYISVCQMVMRRNTKELCGFEETRN